VLKTDGVDRRSLKKAPPGKEDGVSTTGLKKSRHAAERRDRLIADLSIAVQHWRRARQYHRAGATWQRTRKARAGQ